MSEDTEQQTWVETWAIRLETLGLSPVALVLLEAARAFGFLGSQALLVVQPLVTGIVKDTTFERTVDLLESPDLLEQFGVCLKGEES